MHRSLTCVTNSGVSPDPIGVPYPPERDFGDCGAGGPRGRRGFGPVVPRRVICRQRDGERCLRDVPFRDWTRLRKRERMRPVEEDTAIGGAHQVRPRQCVTVWGIAPHFLDGARLSPRGEDDQTSWEKSERPRWRKVAHEHNVTGISLRLKKLGRLYWVSRRFNAGTRSSARRRSVPASPRSGARTSNFPLASP